VTDATITGHSMISCTGDRLDTDTTDAVPAGLSGRLKWQHDASY